MPLLTALVDIGIGFPAGTTRHVEDGRAALYVNAGWAEPAPRLATGGVVYEPQLITLGRDEPEVVFPLAAPTDLDPENPADDGTNTKE